MLDNLDQDSCCMFTNQTNNQTQSKLKLRSDSPMASAQFYDERFFVSLQMLLEWPNELDWVPGGMTEKYEGRSSRFPGGTVG